MQAFQASLGEQRMSPGVTMKASVRRLSLPFGSPLTPEAIFCIANDTKKAAYKFADIE